MMCPAEADREPQSIRIIVYPVGTGLRISSSPSPESKRVMLKRKVANEDGSLDGYALPEDATPPTKKLALAS